MWIDPARAPSSTQCQAYKAGTPDETIATPVQEIRTITISLLPRQLFCSVLEKSPFGAKSNFEIWAFKDFFFGPEKKPQRRLGDGNT